MTDQTDYDHLRAVVARIRQMTDYWEQQLPDVIRTPAVVSAIRAALEPAVSSAGPAPATDRDTLRQRIAEALLDHLSRTADIRPGRNGDPAFMPEITDGERMRIAAHLAAVLPAPADRSAVLLEAADIAEDVALRLRGECLLDQVNGAYEVMSELRRRAGEAQPPLVHVGWWCWRGDNHGHLATMACRSDNVPIHVPAEWADDMRAVIRRLEDDDEPDAPEAQQDPTQDGTCGAREPEPRTGTSPCVLPSGHGGVRHQDKWTNQWPITAVARPGQPKTDTQPADTAQQPKEA